MEVISTERRGASTIYVVREGDRTFTLTRQQVPDDVFKRWRNFQAADCNRRRRERERQNRIRDEESAQQGTSTGVEETQQPLRLSQSNEAKTQEQPQVNDKASQRAIDMITCKICMDAEVRKVIIPCGHLVFCGPCFKSAMSQKAVCPICRSEIKDYFRAILIE